MSKLTLSVDHTTIDAAKDYAKRHGISVSKLVARFLASLDTGFKDDFFTRLHRDLKREGFQDSDEDLPTLRDRHVTKKYL